MAILKKLDDIDPNLMNDLINNDIMVYEDIQGAKIFVNWDGENFVIRPKTITAEPINMIDLAMQKFYNLAYNYLQSLDSRVKSLLSKNWWFRFEYFPDNQPANIKYDKIPKNNLVLTAIVKNGKHDYTIEELMEYANLFNCDSLPVIYYGKLNDRQVQAIKTFLGTSEKDLEFVFGLKNFGFFFYKILNPQLEHSFLMEKDDFQDNIQRLIINYSKDKKDISFSILNPLYKKMSEINETEFTEIYSLILINFLDYSQLIDIKDIKVSGDTKEKIYINIISRLFNMYISDCADDIRNFEIIIPEFFTKDNYRINKELIDNKLTLDYLNEDPKFEYIFKIVLGSLKRQQKKAIGLFTDSTLILFNNFVNKISKIIDDKLNIGHEEELSKTGLMDFSQFYKIKYDKDSKGDVYPDVYTEFGNKEEGGEKKGKNGKKGGETDMEEVKGLSK
jgi:hypothetical protein